MSISAPHLQALHQLRADFHRITGLKRAGLTERKLAARYVAALDEVLLSARQRAAGSMRAMIEAQHRRIRGLDSTFGGRSRRES